MRAPIIFAGMMLLSACATTQTLPVNLPPPVSEQSDGAIVPAPEKLPEPNIVGVPSVPETQTRPPSPPLISVPPPSRPSGTISGFSALGPAWQSHDARPAFASFKKSCAQWANRSNTDAYLRTTQPEFGRLRDWLPACAAARIYEATDGASARRFFEIYFEPAKETAVGSGLLTGYYAPEIPVRRNADTVYYEPLLAAPSNPKTRAAARADINAFSAPVLAYGKPIDVFFMQIQGSGQMRFPDGSVYRAAFDGHNGHPYKSIGAVLIRRGAMTKDQASKGAIEAWMAKAGKEKTRALINQNPRYVFFRSEVIKDGEGPKGGMGVPLTAMGSMAVDKSRVPYGTLVWLDTVLPQRARDFKGKPSGILVSAQDTGGAIKGPARGDLYFGAGKTPGQLAGVMKHKARWTYILPAALVLGGIS